MPSDSASYSDKTLQETPTDATRLLHAIGAVPEIRDIMYAAGMTDDDIIEGRELLLATLAEPSSSKPVVDDEAGKAQRAAMAELDNWDEPNFMRFKAALERRFPSAAQYIFDDLSASRGVQAVQGVATFLARVEHLDKGTDPARSNSKKQDKKAVALLASRGLTEAERKRLQELVHVALGPADAPATTPPAPVPSQRRERLVALKLWYNEWATTAHAVIRKRNHLIRMGLASRRPPSHDEPDTPSS